MSKNTNKESKILKATRDGDQVTLKVQLESGAREKWTYEREFTSAGVSYHQVSREDAR